MIKSNENKVIIEKFKRLNLMFMNFVKTEDFEKDDNFDNNSFINAFIEIVKDHESLKSEIFHLVEEKEKEKKSIKPIEESIDNLKEVDRLDIKNLLNYNSGIVLKKRATKQISFPK